MSTELLDLWNTNAIVGGILVLLSPLSMAARSMLVFYFNLARAQQTDSSEELFGSPTRSVFDNVYFATGMIALGVVLNIHIAVQMEYIFFGAGDFFQKFLHSFSWSCQ